MTKRLTAAFFILLMGAASAQAADDNIVGPLRAQWAMTSGLVTKLAETFPEGKYDFKATPEIRTLRELPTGLPVPRLLWSHEDDLWVLLALEHVEGSNPARPWRRDQLDACLDSLEQLAQGLTPPTLPLPPFARELSDFLSGWDHVRATSPDWPHLDDAAALASRYEQASAGNTVVHTDARDDNFLLTRGGALLCDWNWPVVGAPWIDTVCVLMTAFGDGVDADALLAARPLTRDVDPEHVDVLLALLVGYFLERREQPVPQSSPFLRMHQDWCAEVTWAWLSQRRGWS